MRRAIYTLAACQAIAFTGITIVTTTTAVAGEMLAADKSLATLPLGLQFIVTMLAAVPASMLMQRYGRRFGFLLGSGLGVIGALLAAWGMVIGSFPFFCAAGLLFGAANAVSLYYRHAAADVADDAWRPKAISLVMSGGVVSALFGPEIATWARDLLLPYLFAGSFVFIAGLHGLNLLAISTLRLPKPPSPDFRAGRPLRDIARQRDFKLAVLAAVIGYGVMALLMTATPLAMLACGYDFASSAFVIQWHALGMFATSFATGHLIRRFGVKRIIFVGALVIIAGIGVDLSGQEKGHFWLGLVLLGIGWNFMFVGGTTLLASTHTGPERAKVQAANDTAMFATTAVASFAAGALQYSLGWNAVNYGVLPLMIGAAILLFFLQRRSV